MSYWNHDLKSVNFATTIAAIIVVNIFYAVILLANQKKDHLLRIY